MTAKEAIKMLRTIKRTVYLGNRKFEDALDVAIEALDKDTNVPSNDTISRQATITEIKNYERDSTAPIDYVKIVEQMPPAQPERIQNNAVHLCDSCQYTYVTCPSHGNDAVFGDGKGNDNICACNKYRPISAQQERPKGYMKIKVISAVDGEGLFCENCDAYCLSPLYNFCPKCGVEFIGVRGEQDG